MSERVLEYNRDSFPVAGIFQDLTADIKAKKMSPLEALMVFDEQLILRGLGRRILDYGSTSITTGGHARVPNVEIGHIVAANTRTAQQIVQVLESAGAIEATEMMLSADLGKTGWDQTQYMSFWLLSNAGPDLDEIIHRGGLRSFENSIEQHLRQHEVDLNIMGKADLNREVRRPEYVKFAHAYAALIDSLDRDGVPRQPVRRLISLVDPEISIGCYAEREFARAINIPRLRVTPMSPMATEHAADAVPFPALQEDLRIIQAYGGEICVARAGATLVLQRDV